MSGEQTLPKRNLPRDVFLHLLAVITLYWSAGGFITLLFQHVNYYLPDTLMGDRNLIVAGPLRFAIASLLIVFPVFVAVSYFLEKIYNREPQLREMKLRKWLIYFTLFVAALVIIGDLVRVILVYLEGGVTWQFILKAGSVFVVATLIFGYYLNEIRTISNKLLSKWLVYATCSLMIVGLISSFFIVGTPQNARLKQFDQQKVSDLQNIQYQIANYWQRKEKLPASLNDLADQISGYSAPTDPQTKASYEYRVIDAQKLSFELCANFNLPGSIPQEISVPVRMPEKVGDMMTTWDHEAGRACFTRTIDKQLYPVLNK